MPEFHCLHFSELSTFQLYDILALRIEVFCVEQNCPYQDCDGLDLNSWHLMGLDENGRLVCYTRLLPKGVAYEAYASIGRVVSSPSVRGKGYGKILMEKSIDMCYRLFGTGPIKIGAQSYLLEFYQSFGFESNGEHYLEDGIPHTRMIKP